MIIFYETSKTYYIFTTIINSGIIKKILKGESKL